MTTSGVRIHLEDSERWTEYEGVYVRGRAFRDGSLLAGDSLAALFSGLADLEAVAHRLDTLNGFFAVIVDGGDRCIAAVDHMRSVPLYYATDGPGYVSDSASWIRNRIDASGTDRVAEAEFLVTRFAYVTGPDTLVPDVSQLQAGETVALGDDRGSQRSRWFRYPPVESLDLSRDRALDHLERSMDGAFDRLARVADGRPVALGLSGGYDSLLAALCLDRSDVEDIVTFTHSRPGGRPLRLGRRVADRLDVEWHPVEYTEDRWSEWHQSSWREAFHEWAFDFDAIPQIDSLPAIHTLSGSGAVPQDAVGFRAQAIPHVSFRVPDALLAEEVDRSTVVDAVLSQLYDRWEWSGDRLETAFRNRIDRTLGDGEITDPAAAVRAYERHFWQEVQGKSVSQSNAAFEFHGHDWWFPQYDRAVVECWASLPVECRRRRSIYVALAERCWKRRTGESWTQFRHDGLPLRHVLRSRLRTLIARVIRPTPLSEPLRSLRDELTGSQLPDPIAMSGIVPDGQLERIWTGHQSLHSIRAMESVGRLSFDPPAEAGVPEGPLTLDALERTG